LSHNGDTVAPMTETKLNPEQQTEIISIAQHKLDSTAYRQQDSLWFPYDEYMVEVWWEHYCYYVTIYRESSVGVSQVCGLGRLFHAKQREDWKEFVR